MSVRRRASLASVLRGGRSGHDRRSRRDPARAPRPHRRPRAGQGGAALLPRPADAGPHPHLGRAARADPALRDRALPARGAQGRPGRHHAAELPGVRGRLLRRPADRRDPGQHEPDVRGARDARAVRGLGLRDAGAPRPVLPAPAGDPRRDPRPPRDRGGRDRGPALAGPHARSAGPVAPGRAGEGPGRDRRLASSTSCCAPTRRRRPGRACSPRTWRSCSTPAARPGRPRARC